MIQKSQTVLGRVTSSFIDRSENRIYVNVLVGPGSERRDIPFSTLRPGMWLVPEEGDIVEVYEVDREWAARFPHNPSPHQMPTDLTHGDVCIQVDENTRLHFHKTNDGYDVRIDSSEKLTLSALGNISIETDGDVDLEAAGSVTIGDSSAVSVAVQDHTHPVSWTDDGGSGETGTPSQAGTQTRIT